jgi:1-acyl-sn-glycerol-3-phosphate acyltransferase
MSEFRKRFGRVGWFWHNVARGCAWLFGWKVVGKAPEQLKMVGIVAPHTSNWDVPLMFMMANVFRIKSNWFVKESLFWPPLSWLLRALGALPIERSSRHSYVSQAAAIVREQEQIYLAIAPEGTRKYSDHWKSGFYYIALEAGVPIICMKIDYAKKEVGFGPIIHPTGDVEADGKLIFDFYRDVTPRFPALRTEARFRKEDRAGT